MSSISSSSRSNRFARSRTPARMPSKSQMSVARQVKNVAKKVRVIAKSDPVFKGDNSSSIAVTSLVNSTPQTILLNGIQQGDTQLTRDGVKVNWKSLKMTLLFETTSSLTATHTFYRFMIVRELSCLGSAVSPTQLLNDATPDVLSIFNFTNRDIPKRYKVYYDSGPQVIGARVADYTSATGITVGGMVPARFHKLKVKFNFETDYSRGNAGTVADIDTNSLYLLAFSDNTTASALGLYGSFTLVGHDK